MNSFYISTPIFYVNGAPHIGHAYTTLIADIFARHYRQRGKKVFFLTGTDEHGLKIQRSAESQNMTPMALADRNSQQFKELFDKMSITYDRFLRTTDADHKDTVAKMVERLIENGYIYEGAYEGWYSASDEAFYDDSEVEDGRCLSSGSSVEWIKEPSYFFKLSAFQKPLLDWYDEDPNRVQPQGRLNEIRSFVAGGLKDLSITRTTFEWGIPYPSDQKHILYVWIDALTNYLTGVGGFDNQEMFQTYWPCDIHLIGKDILRFHAVYWPAFLMAANLPLPKQIYAHGWWLNEGEKMSKSRKNFIDANHLIQDYPLDLLRYYFVREISLGSDGNFSHQRIAQRNNSELADNLGNLVNRSIAMAQKFCNSTIPDISNSQILEIDQNIQQRCHDVLQKVKLLMDKRNSADALELIMSLSSDFNSYCADTAPWALNKKGEHERLNVVLYHLLEGLAWIALLAKPFLPDASTKILEALQLPQLDSIESLSWGILTPKATLQSPGVLFEKYPDEVLKSQEHAQDDSPKKKPKNEKKKDPVQENTNTITYQDFLKVEIKCGKILEATRIDGADKLLKIHLDVGEQNPRQVVAGIAQSYDPKDIIGLHVAVVVNLKPVKIFGVESHGMLLAVKNSTDKLQLTVYPDTVAPGERIS